MAGIKAVLHLETEHINGEDAVFRVLCSRRGEMQLHVGLGSGCVRLVDERPPLEPTESPPVGAAKVSEPSAVPDASWAYDDVLQYMVSRGIQVPHVRGGRPSKQRLLADVVAWIEAEARRGGAS